MPIRADLHEDNRRSWNAAVPAHNSHKGDQAAYLRDGGSTLFREELELLGDVRGKRLLHLQCNCGQDTLSLARDGALATGVDISDAAIECARELSARSGIEATFERADVYQWLAAAPAASRDLAFSSYGAIGWLSDLDTWASGIARVLMPDGRLILVEFHPAFLMLDEDERGRLSLRYPYSTHGSVLTWESGVNDYVAQSGTGLVPWGYQEGVTSFANPNPCHEFAWGISDLLSAILRAGLVLETFREYPVANGWRPFRRMTERAPRRFALPEELPPMPLMFGLAARRPARASGTEKP